MKPCASIGCRDVAPPDLTVCTDCQNAIDSHCNSCYSPAKGCRCGSCFCDKAPALLVVTYESDEDYDPDRTPLCEDHRKKLEAKP